jgi:hypothetical protein
VDVSEIGHSGSFGLGLIPLAHQFPILSVENANNIDVGHGDYKKSNRYKKKL